MCSMRGASTRCSVAFVARCPVKSVASGKSVLIARASSAVAASGAKYIADSSSPVVTLRRAASGRRGGCRLEVSTPPAGSPKSGSAKMTGWLPAGARHLHPQEIAAAGDVAHRVSLDQVAAALVDERFERHEIELAVGRDDQTARVAERRAQRPHHPLVDGAGALLHIGAPRIAQRLAQLVDRLVDLIGRTEIEAARRAAALRTT